ncbi:Uncharacterised protein [Mycobacteroides abscessus subsp. abscessus]|nr:Uncharacterised protein [Mycobacteroides abscessus subsp. abscessus]
MPYQKIATGPRSSAGMLAPNTPNVARAKTGKGTPSRWPAIPIRLLPVQSTSTPVKSASIVCQPVRPSASMPTANP